MSNRWSHSARVSVARVWESLELHSLARVHFFAETKKVESSVRADLILHAWKKRSLRVDTAVIDLLKLIYSLYEILSIKSDQISRQGVGLVQTSLSLKSSGYLRITFLCFSSSLVLARYRGISIGKMSSCIVSRTGTGPIALVRVFSSISTSNWISWAWNSFLYVRRKVIDKTRRPEKRKRKKKSRNEKLVLLRFEKNGRNRKRCLLTVLSCSFVCKTKGYQSANMRGRANIKRVASARCKNGVEYEGLTMTGCNQPLAAPAVG